ncbi:MAG: FprA family A-type flavoprotein [Clostridia bacterium]
MKRYKISDGVYVLTMNVEDILFEGMWDIKNGVSLNSYIVKGDKTAIIDGVVGWDGVPETLYKNLEDLKIEPSDIDYLIVNHMEPDHSGWIDNIREIAKNLKIVCSEKASQLVKAFYGEEDDIMIVSEGDSIDLGQGKVLSFHPFPNLHWPDTMLTYERSTKTLFTCDMYGSFGKMSDHIFDDQMTSEEVSYYETEGIRYYSNVMTTFTSSVKKAIDKTKEFNINIIAPGHGPIYRANPDKIINDYTRFTQYADGAGKNEVTILWGSMYGMTEKAVHYAEKVLEEEGIKVNKLKMPLESQSDMIANAFKAGAIIIAAPTYEYKMFPPVAIALDELGRKKVSNKAAFRFGSYGWSGGAERELNDIMNRNRMKWDFVETVEFNGAPLEEDLLKVKEGVLELIEKMKDKVIS